MKKRTVAHVVSFLVVVGLIITAVLHKSSAVGGYTAYDVLGHLPATYVPTFTQGTAQSNFGTPNNFGLFDPTSTALDTVNHRLYVADIDNNRVLVYQLSATNTQTSLNATYVLGQPDMMSTAPATTINGMDSPRGVAVDTVHERVFVVEYDNSRVLVFDVSAGNGGLVSGMDASWIIGETTFTSSTAGNGRNHFTTPRGVEYNEEHELLFVSDTGNHRVLVFDARTPGSPNRTLCGYVSNGLTLPGVGMNASCVYGQPDFTTVIAGTTDAKLNFPRNTSFYSTGPSFQWLAVGDTNNNRVVIYDLKDVGLPGDGLVNGASGTIFIGQPDAVSLTAGSGATGLNNPRGVAFADFGTAFPSIAGLRLFVADYGNNRVLEYNWSSLSAFGSSADFVLGQGTIKNFSGTSAGTTRQTLSSPFFITVDESTANLFITDFANNRILEWAFSDFTLSDPAVSSPDMDYVYGQVVYSYGPPSFTESGANNSASRASPDPYPNLVGYGSMYQNDGDTTIDTVRHKLYVSDANNNRVLVYNLDGTNTLIDRFPDAVLGQTDYYYLTTAGQGANKFNTPKCLEMDETRGYLFVCDSQNLRVLVFDVSGGATTNMNASFVLGQINLATTDTLDTLPVVNRIGVPVSLQFDDSSVAKNLYVVDGSNNRLLVFPTNAIADGMNASFIMNASAFNYTAATNASDPHQGLAFDTARKYLYVGRFDGTTTSDVAVYDVSSGPSNNMTPVFATGTFTGEVSGMSYSQTSKTLFVSNKTENKVLAFDFSTITAGESATGVLGQPSFGANTPGTSADLFGEPIGSAFDDGNRRLYQNDSYSSRVLLYKFITYQPLSLSVANGTEAVGFFQDLNTSGEITNYQGTPSLEVVSGTLPPGLSFSGTTLTGTPTTAGVYTFTVRAVDTFGPSLFYSNEVTLTMTVDPAVIPTAPIAYLATDLLGQLNGSNLPDYTTNTLWNGGSLSGLGLSQPFRVVTDTVNHRVFVSDGGDSRVLIFNTDSSNNFIDRTADYVLGATSVSTTALAGPTINSFGPDQTGLGFGVSPVDIAVDTANQRLFVSDSNRVLVFDLSGTITDGMSAANILGGQASANSNDTLSLAQNTGTFSAIAYDNTNGILYGGDGTGSRILAFDVRPAGSPARTLCGVTTTGLVNNMNASCILNGAPGTAFFSLVVDESRGILFASALNNTVYVYDINTTVVTQTICGVATSGMTNGESASCVFNPPLAYSSYTFLGFDQNKKQLLISDWFRYLVYNTSSIATSFGSPTGVLGFPDFVTTGPVTPITAQTAFSNVSASTPALGADFDEANNRFFVADHGNNRIMIFNFVEISNTTFPNGTVGSVYAPQTLTNINSQGTVSYALTSGSLPPGLTLSSGLISGTPTTAGTYTFTLQATDAFLAVSNFLSNEKTFSITIDLGGSDLCPNINGVQVVVPPGMVLLNGNCVDPGGGPVDFCPNIAGNQLSVPVGMIVNSSGDCVTPSADMCPNITGIQLTVPAGMVLNSSGNCVESATGDMCPNIPGIQSSVPSGLLVDGLGNCVSPSPTDLCPNIIGNQALIPAGMIIDSLGNCVVSPSGGTDVCPNIPGNQATVPVGLVTDSSGNCVVPSGSDMCPNITGFQATVPSGMIVDSLGNCVVPSSGTDMCPNIPGNQLTIPSGMIVDSGGSCVTPSPSDLCPNLPGSQSTIPIGMVVDVFGDCINAPVGGTDLCPNIIGNQLSIPFGMVLDSFGNCVNGPSGGTDVCPNIAGNQVAIPSGMVIDSSNGYCVTPPQICTDPIAINYGEVATCLYAVGLCSDVTATNFGGPLPCTYTPPATCNDPTATNFGAVGACTYPPTTCNDPTADNYGAVGICTYTTLTCSDPTADNFGFPLPCTYPPATCNDPTATNFGAVGACTYPPMTCNDPTADNFGAVGICTYTTLTCSDPLANNYGFALPCTYDDILCSDPAADNFGAVGVCTYPPVFCNDPTADNYGAVGVCTYTSPTCTNPTATNFGGPLPCVLPPGATCNDPTATNFGAVGACTYPPTTGPGPIIPTVGFIAGLGVFFRKYFLNPISFGKITYIPDRIWSLFLIAFGIRKRNRPWGTVYNAVTKEPIDPAVVVLYDQEGRQIATCMTDTDGRYEFAVDPGIYRLFVKRAPYLFPSKLLNGLPHDEVYNELYFGGYFEVKEKGEVVKKNIPMDPPADMKQEDQKKNYKLWRILGSLADILFIVGLLVTTASVIISPVWYNILIFVLYLGLLLFRQLHLKPKSGAVIETETNRPVSFGILRVHSAVSKQEVMARVLDVNGAYYALIPNGKYYVVIEKRTNTGKYVALFQSENFDVKNGVINQKFQV